MGLSDLELHVLQLLGIVIGSLVTFLASRAMAWLNLKLSAEQRAALEIAVDKMMTFGVAASMAVIRTKGWDHPDSRFMVIDSALDLMERKYSGTLSRNGLNLADSSDRLRLQDMMTRMWPDIATRLSASPVTPPVPLPVVVDAPTPIINVTVPNVTQMIDPHPSSDAMAG